MIRCDLVRKTFGAQLVIDALSFEFKDCGFYLLYGESGSGKTTFFNILCGFQNFDNGSININGNEYVGIVDSNSMANIMDYIVQDTIYVEFLTVLENLELVCDDSEKIKCALQRFGLDGKENQYPSTLSGGEKQRLAIARALLGDKKILFLDEPTAALDVGNKIEVFEYLKMIKDEVLIICSSHDAIAKKYADEILIFEKNNKICNEERNIQNKPRKKSGIIWKKKNELKKNYGYIKKWFHSKRRNKGATILFGLFLTVAICLCTLADTPDRKYESNIEYMYKINQCQIEVKNDRFDKYNEFCAEEGISEVVIPYGYCIPDLITNHDSIMQEIPDYDVDLSTLPYSKDAFHLSNRILYGTYFTDELQVVLSYDKAIEMNKYNPESLVGSKITKKVYKYGNIDFEIVGIFDKFNDIDKSYFGAISVDNGAGIYTNSRFTKRYIIDEGSASSEFKRYDLYFNTYNDMKNFHNSNTEGTIFYPSLPKTREVFVTLYNIMFPLSIFIALFTILFYTNLIKTEISYNNKFISVFEYSGYNKKKVIRYFIWMNLLHLLRVCFISAISAFVVTFVMNKVNYNFGLFGFQLFTYNVCMIGSFIVGIVIISIIIFNIMLRRVKFSSWYENIITQRDLL